MSRAIVTPRVITCKDQATLEFVLNNMVLPTTYQVLDKGNGGFFSLVGIDGNIGSAEATSVLAQFVNPLTELEENAITIFVNQQVLNGNWALIDEFQCYAMLDSANALKNWKSAGTAVNVNASVHLAGEGYSFVTASLQYLNSGIIPSALTNYAQDDALCGFYLRTPPPAGLQVRLGGVNDLTSGIDFLINTSGTNRLSINDITLTTTIAFAENQNIITTRDFNQASQERFFINGSLIGQSGQASTGVPALIVYVGARNSNGSIQSAMTGTLSSFVIGAEIGFDHVGFNQDLHDLMGRLAVA